MSKFVFGQVPVLKKKRTRFNLNQPIKTTMSVGDLCPIYCQEIYPGDSFKVKTAFFSRLSVPFRKVPIDNLFMDVAFYFVPNRLTYEHWAELMGENKTSKWTQPTAYSTPTVTVPANVGGKTVASYFGIPNGCAEGIDINALPFRAFALIYNYWWRDENNIDPTLVNLGSTDGTLNNNAWSASNYLGLVPKAARLHDYFSTCLPGTQKGTAASIPLTGTAPVKTSASDLFVNGSAALHMRKTSGTFANDESLGVASVVSGTSNKAANIGSAANGGSFPTNSIVYPSNLYADLSAGSGGATINDLRLNIQIQKLYELDARAGTRYKESVLSHFGVGNNDGVLQEPQFLGGRRVPLNIQGIAQTSSDTYNVQDDDFTNLLGQFSGTSISSGFSGYSKSFTEHGFVIGVAVIRYLHTYQQGIERFWSRTGRLSYYDPLFSHLGEQAVYKKELDATHTGYDDVFGYQEAFADLRYRPALITGNLNMTRNTKQFAQLWHFGDFYVSSPILGPTFINENADNVLRTIGITEDASNNYETPFIVDFYHKVKAIRVLPSYGVPGLMDH